MAEFFRGWKRKLGVVTLVFACLFTAGWIRCRYYEDWRIVQLGGTFYLLRSDHGGFSCNKFDRPPDPTMPFVGSQPVQRFVVLSTGSAPRDDLFIDYSTGAILLTLSSAWLLLSPLRKPKTEPLKVRV